MESVRKPVRLGFWIMLRMAMGFLLAATSVAQAFDFSRPAANGCLEQRSKAWCLMATKGFGNQLQDVPAATPAAAADLDATRAVSQGVQAGSVALNARAVAGFDPNVSRAMGGVGIVLDLLTYQDPSMPLRSFQLLVWMPKDFPQTVTPKIALEKLLVQAMMTATGSTGVEPVDFKWEALFKTDTVHYYKLVGEGPHQGRTFDSRLWQYNDGQKWAEGKAPEYLGGADSYTFELDIVPRFSTVEKKPALNYNLGVVTKMSAVLPAWAIIYVPPLGGKNPYLLQQGNVLAFESPVGANAL
jgi:hypothetical protein